MTYPPNMINASKVMKLSPHDMRINAIQILRHIGKEGQRIGLPEIGLSWKFAALSRM